MTGSIQKDFFLETREIKEMEYPKSQSPDLNYILRVHSGANLIIKHHIKTKPTFSFQFDILRNHKIYPECIGRNKIESLKGF